MEVFDKEYAKRLRQTGKHNALFDYCLSFPDDAKALSYLALCYHNGYGTSKDREMAFSYDSKSSELGCADGKAGLALDYLYGYGTSKDEEKGMKLLLEAINEGSVPALRYLGYCYEDGVGVEKDERKAVECYSKAAESGNAVAMRYLGVCCEEGTGVEKDETKAIEWYNKAAEAKDAKAMRFLGINYENGIGTEKDERKAVEWYSKAAEFGDAIAMRYLGVCYEEGIGVEKNETKTFEWYQKAAEFGDTVAMRSLGVCYEEGAGVEKDETKAFVWFHKAAESGDAVAMRCLGVCYEEGTGVEKDEAKAVEWYCKAAEVKDAKAMCFFGINYENGIGVEKDEKQAVEWYRKAAESGDTTAMTCLGECYENGTGVEKNGSKAIEWYHKAMDSGDESAEYRIGKMFFDGEAVEKNIQKAVDIFERRHITKKDCLSTYYLARCYLIGEGVALNLKKAFELFNIAANQGHILSNIYLIYLNLRGIGTKKNYKKTNRLISLLENKEEYEDYQDYINLYKGIIYYHGLGRKKDTNKAKELFDKAPGVGTALYSPLCDGDYRKANFLGSIIFNSRNIAVGFLLYPDKVLSKDLLTKAYDNECLSLRGHRVLLQTSTKYRKSKKARKTLFKTLCNDLIMNNDDADLLCSLGRCYFYGYGTKQNYNEAVSLFVKSSALGDSYARVYLAYCYYNGLGVEKNNAKVVEVLGESIENRGDQANVLLGLLTHLGMCGIEKDKKRGVELVKAASSQNSSYNWFVDYLTSSHANSYASFFLEFFFKRLHFSFDPSIKFRHHFSLFAKFLFLLIFRSPNSTSLSKKELFRILLEKDDELKQYQKQARIEIENLTAKMEDIGRDVKIIGQKIDTLILTLQKEITNEKQSFLKIGSDGEEEYQEFVNSVAKKMSNALYQSGNASVDFEEATLKGLFDQYWDTLDVFTRKALVSARVFLANCSSVSYSGLDYSGVCISSCSALEQELKLRFFTGYQEYLKHLFKDDFTKWPTSMKYRQKDGSYIANTNFTIGSLPYIFGSKKRDDKTGKRSETKISSNEKELLEEYIKTILNNPMESIHVFFDGYDSGTCFLDRCEDVRCIYRNTAAHTKTLSLETATACCREVIGGETAAETVGQVQGLIYDLVRLTRLPNNLF